jgi:hypothetical protein
MGEHQRGAAQSLLCGRIGYHRLGPPMFELRFGELKYKILGGPVRLFVLAAHRACFQRARPQQTAAASRSARTESCREG